MISIPIFRWSYKLNNYKFSTFMIQMVTTPRAFNFYECLAFLNRSALECTHKIEDQKVYKALRINGKTVLFRLQEDHLGLMKLDFLGTSPGKHLRVAVLRYIREWFDLDRDLAPFFKMAAADPVLKTVSRKYYGLRLIRIPDFFEVLCWAIIGQQIQLRFAYTLKRRLVERFGEKIRYGSQDYWLFPAPEVISGLQPAQLLALQFSRRKAEYLIGIARRVDEGSLSKAMLQALETVEEQRRTLLKLRGVGEWTADYVLMKCLGNPAAFPAADVGLHNAIKRVLNRPVKPTVAEIREMARSWEGWEAYATIYLWRSLV